MSLSDLVVTRSTHYIIPSKRLSAAEVSLEKDSAYGVDSPSLIPLNSFNILGDSNMAADQGKMATDNNPNIIVTLVARSHRAYEAWADPHNEPFYIPPKSHARDGRPREGTVGPNDDVRQPTPDEDDPNMIDPSEPALQITFSMKPRNPELGYLLGSDRKVCDIFFGSTDDWISQRMFIINLNQYNEVTMTSLTNANVVVSYGKQQGTRRKFTWLFPPEQKSIFVKATKAIEFTVEVPTHKTDQESYKSNCRELLELANRAGRTTSQATRDRPFYLRTVKIGDGGYGKVHRARSMPDGRVVAVKQFKSKRAFALEADVLRKIATTPHVSTRLLYFRNPLTYGLG